MSGIIIGTCRNKSWETIGCFPGGSDGKASACNAEDAGLIPGSGRSPGEGTGNPLQYYCLENSMDRGAWWATVHGVTIIKPFSVGCYLLPHHLFLFHPEMAPDFIWSSILPPFSVYVSWNWGSALCKPSPSLNKIFWPPDSFRGENKLS